MPMDIGLLSSIMAGAALALVMGIKRPPLLVSTLLLAAIAVLGLGLATLTGTLYTMGRYIIVIDLGYILGLSASLMRRIRERPMLEEKGVFGAPFRLVRLSESPVDIVLIRNGEWVVVNRPETNVKPIISELRKIIELSRRLSKGGKLTSIRLGRASDSATVKIVLSISDLENLTYLVTDAITLTQDHSVLANIGVTDAVLVYKDGRLAYIIPVKRST